MNSAPVFYKRSGSTDSSARYVIESALVSIVADHTVVKRRIRSVPAIHRRIISFAACSISVLKSMNRGQMKVFGRFALASLSGGRTGQTPLLIP